MKNKPTLLKELLSGVIPGTFTANVLAHTAPIVCYKRLDQEEQENVIEPKRSKEDKDLDLDTDTTDMDLPDENLDLDDQIGEPKDPDHQGVIRTVKHAHLVYKRKNEEGSYDELWVYNIGDKVNDELEIRRDILAGTDILPKSTTSEDRSQQYTVTTLGNAQILHITGLPN